jgi:TolB protein
MYKKILFFCCVLFVAQISVAQPLLDIKLTSAVKNSIPLALLPLLPEVDAVVRQDLANSGQFTLPNLSQSARQDDDAFWREQGVHYLLIGERQAPAGSLRVDLVNLYANSAQQRIIFSQVFDTKGVDPRRLGHHISDLIYEALVGKPGVFSTQIAYVVVNRTANTEDTEYSLEVADIDGFNAQPLLKSSEPIMSPAWSPQGDRLAYVSFEKQQAQIYVHALASGRRRLVTSFPGINGAPAWSPDGKQLAVVLSKSGYPKIYIADIASGRVQQLTQGYAIDTEPTWSPDGKKILFTSSRGGGPQIYQVDLHTKQVSRVTFSGNYNARANFTPDGRAIVMLHRDRQGNFAIAKQDLATGRVQRLTQAHLDESPSVAPNGSMVLFARNQGQRMQLGMVSIDGRIQLQLPARQGDVQEPAWSPYL